MIITKQLEVLIQSSLAQGRDYDDVRSILLKQGFQDADISELFSQYRGGIDVSKQINKEVVPVQTSVVPKIETKDKLFTKDFVHPEVKAGFVPVGFESEPSPQANVQEDVQKFMNVGTNTETAGDVFNREQSRKLPAPGTTLLPNELLNQKLPAPGTTLQPSELLSQKQNSTTAEPKVLNETGLVDGEVTAPPIEITQAPVEGQKYINVGFGGMPEMEKVLAEEKAKKIEKSAWPLVMVLLILLSLIGGFLYWFFIANKDNGELTESEKLLQELQNEKKEVEAPVAPPEPTGPRDPFTGELLENK